MEGQNLNSDTTGNVTKQVSAQQNLPQSPPNNIIIPQEAKSQDSAYDTEQYYKQYEKQQTNKSKGPDVSTTQQDTVTTKTDSVQVLNANSTIQQQVDTKPVTTTPQVNIAPPIKSLLNNDDDITNVISPNSIQNFQNEAKSTVNQENPSLQNSPHKAVVTKVTLTDELNIFDWFRTTDIINQIAEKAKHSVDSVITVLDPGMKEYLYSGGNINIIVISDSISLISPIRDAFQSVFGRATVTAAKYNPTELADDYPIRLANGFDGAIMVAQERIKRLRLHTSTVPQNQVIMAVQPSLVRLSGSESASNQVTNGLKLDENLVPEWFLTYCMLIEDPVLGSTMNSYSQFIPIDKETVTTAKEQKLPNDFEDKHLGFATSIYKLINSKHNAEDKDYEWFKTWCGIEETDVIHNLSISLAHLYRRKWSNCLS